jgi:hypothetical protein
MEWKKLSLEQPENGESVIAYDSQKDKAIVAHWSNGSLPLKKGFWEAESGYQASWKLFHNSCSHGDELVFWMRLPKRK